MEPLFKNSYKKDKRIHKDLYNYLYFKNPVVKFFLALLWIGFIFIIIASMSDGDFSSAISFGGLILFWYLFLFLSKNSRTVMMYSAQKEMTCKENYVIDTSFYEDYAEVCTSLGEKIKLNYSVIKRVKVLKKITLIRTKANLFYVLKNDSFTKGQMYECLEFLRNKRIKVK